MRDYIETKIRTLLTRRKRRQKRSIGWRLWSNEYLYGVLGLYWTAAIQQAQGLNQDATLTPKHSEGGAPPAVTSFHQQRVDGSCS